MKNYPLITTILLFLTACSHDNVNVNDFTTIKINNNNIIEDMDYSDFVEDEIKLVFLESGENKMIGKISDLRIVGDTIYILDEVTQSIFRFNMDGSFISKLSARGKAGNEYNELRKSWFDVRNMNLYVLDRFNNRILIYDKENQFIKSVKLNSKEVGIFFGETIIVNEDETFDLFDPYANLSKHHFLSFNKEGTIISSQLPVLDFEMSPTWQVTLDNHITVSESKRLSYRIAVDTIYETKNNRIFPLFAVNFGAKKLTDAQKTDGNGSNFLRNYVGIRKVALGGNYLFIYFKMDKKNYVAVCSDKGELIGVTDKLTYRGVSPYIEINAGIITDDYLISVSQPAYMKGTQGLYERDISKYKDTLFMKNARSKFETYNRDEGNPVLTIMKWKK